MKRLLLASLLALAAPAAAQEEGVLKPGSAGFTLKADPPTVPANVTFQAPLVGLGAAGCYPFIYADTGQIIRNTRSTTATIFNSSAGFLATCAGTYLRTDGTNGLVIQPSRANVPWPSENLSHANWVYTNAAQSNAGDLGPDGSTAYRVTSSVADGFGYNNQTDTANGTKKYNGIMFFKTPSGTQDVTFCVYDVTGSTCACTVNLTATTTWQMASCFTSAAPTNAHTIAPAFWPGKKGSGNTGTVVAWGGHIDSTTTAIGTTAYVKTSTGTVARNTDVVVTDTGAALGASWSISADVTFGPASINTSTMRVMRLMNDSTNFVEMYFAGSNFNCAVDIAGSTTTRAAPVISYTAGSTYHVLCKYTSGAPGSLAMCNGTCATTSTTLATAASYSAIHLGDSTGGSNPWSGWIKNVCVGKTDSACQ